MSRVFIDIDSLLRPVYGHAKQGASYGHTKIAGKQILRKGLSPLATTISTAGSRAGDRRDAATRRARPARPRAPGGWSPRRSAPPAPPEPAGQILVRGDSAYGNRAVVAACVRARRPVLAGDDPQPGGRPRDRRDRRAMRGPRCPTPARSAIPTPAPGSPMPRSPKSPTPLSHPPPTGSPPDWWCAGSRTPASPTRCSRCGGITRSSPTPTYPSTQADITHRQHAIIETVFADLIDGPLAHIPSGRFGANSAWVLCAAIAHNLLRAAGVLAGDRHTRARGSTLRRRIVNIPGPTGPPPTPTDPAPAHPLALVQDLACAVAQHHRTQPTTTHDTLTTRRQGPTGAHRKSWTDQQLASRPHPDNQDQPDPTPNRYHPSVDRG